MKIYSTITIIAFTCILLFSSGCTFNSRAPVFTESDTKGVSDSVEMVIIPGGTYKIGSKDGDPDEQPVHEVALDPFYIDVHEVTNRQFQEFFEATGRPKPDFWHPELDHPNEPVVGVSWYDAVAYAAWVGKRLPTETEWEVAARGGRIVGRYPWGDEPDVSYANFKSFGIAPVKSFKPNDLGIYDMIGNVWEWCSDWYDSEYYSISSNKNPKGSLTGANKVLRGGAWYCGEEQVRVTNRYYATPDTKSFNISFRCAMNAPK